MLVEWLTSSVLLFFVALAIGTYIQTNTGFAFGLIVISLGSALGLLPIDLMALLVSGLSLVNSSSALKGHSAKVDRKLLYALLIGCLPGTLLGILLLNQLSLYNQSALQITLGASVILCGFLMMLKPAPQKNRSPNALIGAAGFIGGILGGLFATFGPPMAFVLYRQPLSIQTIRYSLLAAFWFTAIMRISLVGLTNVIPENFYYLMLLGIPWVVVCTWFSKRFPPRLSETHLRRCAFVLLIIAGISTTASGLNTL